MRKLLRRLKAALSRKPFQHGGYIPDDGSFAKINRDTVLPRALAEKYQTGKGKGNVNIIIHHNYGESPQELLKLLDRSTRDRG